MIQMQFLLAVVLLAECTGVSLRPKESAADDPKRLLQNEENPQQHGKVDMVSPDAFQIPLADVKTDDDIPLPDAFGQEIATSVGNGMLTIGGASPTLLC